MDLTNEQIKKEFIRQVKLCSGIGRKQMHEIVDAGQFMSEDKTLIPEAVHFAIWLWNEDEFVHLDGDRWGKEKMDSIELEAKEYSTLDLYDYWKKNVCDGKN